MPSLGWQELLLVLLIVVIIFGAGKLPEIGGAVGRGIKEFRTATRDEEGSDGVEVTETRTTTTTREPVHKDVS
jgi:sec-independent protein translocase protein TatA